VQWLSCFYSAERNVFSALHGVNCVCVGSYAYVAVLCTSIELASFPPRRSVLPSDVLYRSTGGPAQAMLARKLIQSSVTAASVRGSLTRTLCTPTLLSSSLSSSATRLEEGRVLGIRREESSVWERRAPLSPNHVQTLVSRGVKVSRVEMAIKGWEIKKWCYCIVLTSLKTCSSFQWLLSSVLFFASLSPSCLCTIPSPSRLPYLLLSLHLHLHLPLLQVLIQPSSRRAYTMKEYQSAGAVVQDDLTQADTIIGTYA